MKPGGSLLRVTLTISSTQTALYDMRAAYIAAGYPSATRVLVTLLINAVCQRGIEQGTGSGGWPAGSSCVMVNTSTVAGTGGNGGSGAYTTAGGFGGAGDGAAGGDAIKLRMPTTLDNGSGYIYGGGGGGGGGGAAASFSPPSTSAQAAGGGGGGGRGYNNATGGAKGTTAISPTGDGSVGGAGSSSAAGSGGAQGQYGLGPWGGDGGNGGGWGAVGSDGQVAEIGTYKQAPGDGGAAGKAIAKNGFDLTITAGNNSTQIKGSVA